MGNGPSCNAPTLQNTCTDTDDPNNQNVQVEGFCIASSTTDFVLGQYCNRIGGSNPSGNSQSSGGENPNTDPEWGFSSQGGYASCTYGDGTPSGSWATFGQEGGNDCSKACGCNIEGSTLSCKRVANLGDPLSCCLRDFQCNGASSSTSKFCFSDDGNSSTCAKDFRATDTPPCQFLTTQLCLGNIPNAFASGQTGIIDDFTVLWVNQNPDSNSPTIPWQVNGLPSGSTYRTIADISDPRQCQYYKDGTLVTNSCDNSTYTANNLGVSALTTPTPYQFGQLPPCQQLFWRTLYGNQPTFQNNYWRTEGSLEDVGPNTSIQPQVAACAPQPFDGTASAGGIAAARTMLEAAVQKFEQQGGNFTASVSTLKDEPFTSWVFSVCAQNPILCKDLLINKICNTVTKEDIKFNPFALQWCGCYMSDSNYSDYDKLAISKPCTPYCNNPDVIPLVDDLGNIQYCNQSLCVIDNVTLTLAQSKVGSNGITMNNICTSCSTGYGNNVNSNVNSNSVSDSGGGGTSTTYTQTNINTTATSSCQCIIDNFNLTTIGAAINGGINISNSCNGNAKCFNTQKIDGVNQRIEVDCHTGSLSANNVAAQAEARLIKKAGDTSNYLVIFIFILCVLVILFFYVLLSPPKLAEKDITFTKTGLIPEPPAPKPMPMMLPPPIIMNYGVGFSRPKSKFF